MAKTVEQSQVVIPRMQIKELDIVLVGDSPLVVHAWSTKAKQMMLDKQMKRAVPKKDAKDPEQDYIDSLYWVSERPAKPTLADVKKAKLGFPTIAFKGAAIDACSHVEGMTKVMARGTFHIPGQLATILGTPSPREDMVRVGMGTADIRYRAEFWPWRVALRLRYSASVISAEQLVNLFEIAGFAIGVGEGRPQRDGQNGLFHVARKGE
jgi:hypothetical protein